VDSRSDGSGSFDYQGMHMINIVAISHGVENTDNPGEYARGLIEGIKSKMTLRQFEDFIFIQLDTNQLFQPRQMEIYKKVEKGLRRQFLRKLKHTIGSDVVWSNRSKSGNDAWSQKVNYINQMIDPHVRRAGEKNYRIHLIGHSQGSQDLLEYCFDCTYPAYGLITMGSPISMKSGTFEDWGHLPKGLGYWHNFYNTLDFIGSRLEKVHPSKEIADFVIDHEVPIGWNPLEWTKLGSHCCFWKRDFVHRTIATILVSG